MYNNIRSVYFRKYLFYISLDKILRKDYGDLGNIGSFIWDIGLRIF